MKTQIIDISQTKDVNPPTDENVNQEAGLKKLRQLLFDSFHHLLIDNIRISLQLKEDDKPEIKLAEKFKTNKDEAKWLRNVYDRLLALHILNGYVGIYLSLSGLKEIKESVYRDIHADVKNCVIQKIILDGGWWNACNL